MEAMVEVGMENRDARSARHVLLGGRVQGVAFRWYTREKAEELGIAGWVRNLHDGRVEASVEGETRAVEAMVAWLRRGPPAARVATAEVTETMPANAATFEIRPSAHAPGA